MNHDGSGTHAYVRVTEENQIAGFIMFCCMDLSSWFFDTHTARYVADKYGVDAFCNCKEKSEYKRLPIPEEERAIPTAPEGSRILAIAELLVSRYFSNCGLEEKLLNCVLTNVKRQGYTHAEVYPLERMELDKEQFNSLLSLYEKAGFTVIRDLSSEQDGRYFIMQKEL